MSSPCHGIARSGTKIAGQRFVHHVADAAVWRDSDIGGVRLRDLGIAEATEDWPARACCGSWLGTELPLASTDFDATQRGALFLYLLDGSAVLRGDASATHAMDRDDACAALTGASAAIRAASDCELLAVAMPA